MISILLNTLALDPQRWSIPKQPYYALVDVLPKLAEVGFRQLEVWQYHITSLDDRSFKALRTEAKHWGITCPIVGAYPQLNPTGKAASEGFRRFQAIVERAVALEAEAVKIFAGNQATESLTGGEYRQAIAHLARLVEAAGAKGLSLMVETHRKTLFDSAAAALKIIDEIGDPNLKVCIQPFDFDSTVDFVSDYETLADHVVHVHLQGRKDKQLVLLKDAAIDYNQFLKMMEAETSVEYLSLELVPGSVVESPDLFDLNEVLKNAALDRDFLQQLLRDLNLAIS